MTGGRSAALEEDGARAAIGDLVVGVAERAALQAQAAAADAAVERVAEPLELADLGVEPGPPARG